MKAKSPKQVLIAAKWMLENVGWCKGNYVSYKDSIGLEIESLCILGAINRVEIDEDKVGIHSAAKSMIWELIKKQKQNSSLHMDSAIGTWNDESKRTKKEVIQLLNKAIAQAK